MKKVSLIFILSIAIAAIANAQATRTWVSGVGDDVNPCSRTAPCKTFAGAISKTAAGGIINCLDPGGFGAVTITKSLTIDCTATLGSILSSGVQGIIINGINIIQAATVSIFNCRIANYSGVGVLTSNTSNAISVFISKSEIANISVQGVQANSTAPGTSSILIDHSHIFNCVNGVDIAGSGNSGSVSETVIEKNSGAGFQVEQTGSSGSLESDTFANNGTGVQAGVASNTPTIRISRCLITNNTSGIAGAGTSKCFTNNVVDGNGGGNACSSPTNPQQ